MTTTNTSTTEQPAEEQSASKTDAKKAPEPRSVTTSHQIVIGGEPVAYRATAGWLIVNDAEGQPAAQIGYTAYEREQTADQGTRPVTFAYNGGPGSSSVWLHMGILGPRRIEVADADFTLPPPYAVVDNAESIIDISDLVLIDPVGTGLSKPVGEKKGQEFWGVDQDITWMARFITTWVSAYSRWNAPKILLGESYGGIRSAGVAWELLSKHGMALNGVVLVSPFLSFVDGFDFANVDLPHVLFLPSLAAAAWYHHKLAARPDNLVAFLDEVKTFAYQEYAPALLQGRRLSAEARTAVLTKLAHYTGVDPDYWERANLRVNHLQFAKELLRDRRQATGRIDARFVGPSIHLLGEQMNYDPLSAAVTPAFTAAFLNYYHTELQFGRDMEYCIVNTSLYMDWEWRHTSPGQVGIAATLKLPVVNMGPDLAWAMTQNPHMKLLVQIGYFDLATPLGAIEYAIDHLNIPPDLQANITVAYYEAGHMAYIHPPSRAKFKQDLVRFIQDATVRSPA
jgi:carboxypeptidase C (cathepsin A)